MISLDALAGSEPPRLVIAGDTARSPVGVARPNGGASASSSRPARSRSGTRAVRQLLDLGFPFTLGEQGPFVARGIPAVTLTTLPDGAAEGFATTAHDDTFDVQRLAELGRASQNLIGSLDAGLELAQGTTSYVYFGTRIVRGWAIELVLMTALAAVPDRHDRPLRALPAPADPARAGRPQPPPPALLLGLRRGARLRGVAARRLPAG